MTGISYGSRVAFCLAIFRKKCCCQATYSHWDLFDNILYTVFLSDRNVSLYNLVCLMWINEEKGKKLFNLTLQK